MRRNRLLASLVAMALAAVSIGTATAWFSDSETLRFEITAADDFDHASGEKIWVCKLIGPPDNPSVKPGKNPIQVSVNSVDGDEGFSDTHPSYIVEHGDVVCEIPGASPEPDSRQPDVVDKPVIEEASDTSDSTTTTTVEDTSTTTLEPTTTTTETVTSTTAPDTDSTTTSVASDNDD